MGFEKVYAIIISKSNLWLKVKFMTPSLSAFLSSVFLAVIVVIVPISAALVFVSSSDKIVRG